MVLVNICMFIPILRYGGENKKLFLQAHEPRYGEWRMRWLINRRDKMKAKNTRIGGI